MENSSSRSDSPFVTGSPVRSPPLSPAHYPISAPSRPSPIGRGTAAAVTSPPLSPTEENYKAPPTRNSNPLVTSSRVRSPPLHSPPEVHQTAPPLHRTRPLSQRQLAAAAAEEEMVLSSPVHSPPQEPAENSNHFAPSLRSPTHSPEKDEPMVASGSPLRPPPEHLTEPPPVTGSPARSPSLEAARKKASQSNLRSLLLEEEVAEYHKQNSFSSALESLHSPLRDPEDPISSPLTSHKQNSSFTSPIREGALAMTVASILRTPAGEEVGPTSAPGNVSTVNRMTVSASSVAAGAKGKVGGSGARGGRLPRSEEVARATGWLRVLGVVLSLISFSVMAADKTSGWDGDHYDRYREFRYCFAMNIIAFVYSSFQVYVQLHHLYKKKRVMSRRTSYYFDFSMDQILAYLLMSASSAAASRNDDWVAMFGSDEFTRKINGSIAMSFLAFFAMAFSSLISAYKLFSWNY